MVLGNTQFYEDPVGNAHEKEAASLPLTQLNGCDGAITLSRFIIRSRQN